MLQSCASSPRARVKRRTAKVIFFIVVFLIELFSGMLRDEGLYPGGLVGKGRGWSGRGGAVGLIIGLQALAASALEP